MGSSDRGRKVLRSRIGGGPVTAYSRHRVWALFIWAPIFALLWVGFLAEASWQTGFVVVLLANISFLISTVIAFHLQALLKRARRRDYRQCPFCVADLTREQPEGNCVGCGAQYTFAGLCEYWLDCQERFCVRPDKFSLERHQLGFDVRENSLYDLGKDQADESTAS